MRLIVICYIVDFKYKFVKTLQVCYYLRVNIQFKKYLLWVLVITFAFLQGVSPLLHAHIKGDNVHATDSINVHLLPALEDAGAMIKNADTSIIGVNQSIIRNLSVELLSALLFLVAFLLRPEVKLFSIKLSKNILISFNIRHHTLVPRAPPSF